MPSSPPSNSKPESSPPAFTFGIIAVAPISVAWCIGCLAWMLYRLVSHVQTENNPHWMLAYLFSAQAGLVLLTGVLWLAARARNERLVEIRDRCAGWGMTPALALPALSLLIVMLALIENRLAWW